ncbi:LytR C-terminal domain-containing protein [Arthrobacter sp. TmT3-37]
MTDHPRDEFDAVPEASARQGVHRERLVPARSSGLALKITVGVLALLIGLGAYFILPRLGFPGGSDAASGPAPATSGAADATAAPTGSASDDPEDGATDEPDAGASPDAEATDGTNRAQTVNVLNATGAPGLASVAAGRLAAEGWTSAIPGNWAGAPVDSSVVFYNGEAQRSDAEAVAADLGITDLVDTPSVSPDISVVLGPEFQ